MTNDTSADWKAMYMLLFHGITDALELLPARLENAPACEVLSRPCGTRRSSTFPVKSNKQRPSKRTVASLCRIHRVSRYQATSSAASARVAGS